MFHTSLVAMKSGEVYLLSKSWRPRSAVGKGNCFGRSAVGGRVVHSVLGDRRSAVSVRVAPCTFCGLLWFLWEVDCIILRASRFFWVSLQLGSLSIHIFDYPLAKIWTVAIDSVCKVWGSILFFKFARGRLLAQFWSAVGLFAFGFIATPG